MHVFTDFDISPTVLCGYLSDMNFSGQKMKVTVIGIMTINDFHVVHGTTDGDSFLEFVDNYLLPCLMPFNGINPNSIVILDNCAIHHIEPIKNLIN